MMEIIAVIAPARSVFVVSAEIAKPMLVKKKLTTIPYRNKLNINGNAEIK